MKDTIDLIYPLSRGLPKTGQETSYRAGDDGQYEAGWWRGLLNANNRIRFVGKLLSGVPFAFDKATGLMWPAHGGQAGARLGQVCTWESAIDYYNSLDFGGFTDWRLPNVKELMSIIEYNLYNQALDPYFFGSFNNGNYWSSTTSASASLRAWYVTMSYGEVRLGFKSGNAYSVGVRNGL